MSDQLTLVRFSARIYGWLLHLYPSSFRRAYGRSMRDLFVQWLEDESACSGGRGIARVWRTTLLEFIPTLFRQYADEYAALLRAGPLARLLIACVIPVVACIELGRLLGEPASPVLLAWFALMGLGMLRARGRGWTCSRNAVLAAALGVGTPLLWEALRTVTTPSLFLVGPLLIAAAATIGLILSIYVRLVMEGVTLSAEIAGDGAIPCGYGRHRAAGFSLPELLIVIAIIALLIGILLPVIGALRKTARETACLANVQDLGRSYQMYLNGNRGKSFFVGSDVTSLAWYEHLQPFTGDLARMLLCPEATEPGNQVGSASMAWGPLRTYDTPAPKWTIRGTFVGSYGFNAWLWRLPAGLSLPGDVQTRYVELPAAHADAVPIFADCVLHEAHPLDSDTAPFNLEHPIPTSESGLPGPSGAMAYFCIDRHRRAVNVVFLDGHAVRVPLADLWKLQWNRSFVAREVTVPQ